MIFLHDNAVALIVAGVGLVLMLNLQQQSQRSSLEQSLLLHTKTQTLDAADWITRDLTNAGHGTAPTQPGITAYTDQTIDSARVTTLMEFYSRAADGSAALIRYELAQVDSTTLQGETVPVFRLDRYENGVLAGQSAPALTGFTIDLLTENNTPTDRTSARRVRLRLRQAVAPSTATRPLRPAQQEVYWGVTLTPPNLRDYQG